MQFIDLKAQQARIREDVERRISKILDHGQYILGPEVLELEDKLASYAGTKHCVTCASGTDALLMPLMAMGVGPGDAVFVPSFTFVASAEVVALTGATPIFVDIERETFNIDCSALAACIDSARKNNPELRLKGIIAVDLFGQPADYERLQKIAAENRLFLMEDAAQSFGASYRGKRVGALTPIAAASFFPAKPLGGYGDGGAIFCEDAELKEKLLSIRVHGQGEDKYNNVRVGINGRLDTLQAAILLAKLEIFNEEIELRNKVASRYNELLGSQFVVPRIMPDRVSVWAQYSVLHDDRERCLARLREKNIPAAIYYPKPLHKQLAFDGKAITPCPMLVSEELAGKVFSLPMHPYLKEEEQDAVVQALLG